MAIPAIDPIVVNTPGGLSDLLGRLESEPAVGVDTESNSLYRYYEQVCLIQISIPGSDYVLDPLAVDAEPLGDLFRSRRIQKVFHAGEYDVMCLRRDFGFSFENVFDTMLAAKVLELKRIGLASLLDQFFEVKVDKRRQKDNWGARPLSPEQIRYAALDSRYLLPLRDHLTERMQSRGCLQRAADIFLSVCEAHWSRRPFNPSDCLNLRGARRLDRKERRVLRELFCWREEAARAADLPAFRIAGRETLLKLSMMQPRTTEALRLMTSRRDGAVLEHAEAVLAAIGRGGVAGPTSGRG